MGQQRVDADEGRERVVVGELDLVFLARQRQALDQPRAAVDAGEAAAAVFEPARHDLDAQAGPALDVATEPIRVQIRTQRVDVVQHRVLELGSALEQARKRAVAQQVRDLVPVADRVQALDGDVVAVVAGFAGANGPIDQGGAAVVTHFLLPLFELLLAQLLPGKAQIRAVGTSRRPIERPSDKNTASPNP